MVKEEALHFFRQGFIPSPHEDENTFRERVRTKLDWSKKLWKEDLVLQEENLAFPVEDRFPEELLNEDGQAILKRFGCLPQWVPAYHNNQGLPPLTGGMAVELAFPDTTSQVFFQLKKNYKDQAKWFIYPRREILSHEMCHIVRFPLKSHRYEETLAYSLSQSALRRWLGGALLSPRDNLVLLGSILSWVTVDVLHLLGLDPGFFGWVFRSFLPFVILIGLFRNFFIRCELKMAQTQLSKIFEPENVPSLIFCLSDPQIKWLSRPKPARELIQWWTHLPGFQGTFLRLIFSVIEDTGQKG